MRICDSPNPVCKKRAEEGSNMAEPTVNWDSVNPAALVEWQRELVDNSEVGS